MLSLEPFCLSTKLFLKLHYSWANNEIWTRDLFLTKETLYPWAISAEKVERETRVELATFSLEGWRSTNWATPALISGESRIRTCEVRNSRFTVCPRWPLEYLPKFKISKSRWRDSNPRPADYKSAALASWATSACCKNWLQNKCFFLLKQSKRK